MNWWRHLSRSMMLPPSNDVMISNLARQNHLTLVWIEGRNNVGIRVHHINFLGDVSYSSRETIIRIVIGLPTSSALER